MSTEESQTQTQTQTETQTPFDIQFNTYCIELSATFPEFSNNIATARIIQRAELLKFFNDTFAFLRSQSKDFTMGELRPPAVLPGVVISEQLWSSLSSSTRSAIIEYIRILGMCAFFEGTDSDAAQQEWQNLIGNAMNDMDFSKMTSFFQNFIRRFGNATEASDATSQDKATGSMPFGTMPKLPEKFLRGHLAKLAEELVRDIRPEDLGLTPELLAQLEESPSRAFEMLIQVFTKNPQSLQNTFQRIGKKLQQKVASGQIKPQEIAREAEELMKEFAENTDFVEMMESLKSAFGMEDMDLAKKAGQEGSARLAAVRSRLNKKKEAKTAAAAGAAASAVLPPTLTTQNSVTMPTIDELVQNIEGSAVAPTAGSTKQGKKEQKTKIAKGKK
jgi:hypothetical protein